MDANNETAPAAGAAVSAAALRHLLMSVLNSLGHAVTTAELRHRIQELGFPAAQTESVDRNLNVLQKRGLVRQAAVYGRQAYWVKTVSPNDD